VGLVGVGCVGARVSVSGGVRLFWLWFGAGLVGWRAGLVFAGFFVALVFYRIRRFGGFLASGFLAGWGVRFWVVFCLSLWVFFWCFCFSVRGALFFVFLVCGVAVCVRLVVLFAVGFGFCLGLRRVLAMAAFCGAGVARFLVAFSFVGFYARGMAEWGVFY